ncbi:MAG: hypothetical protein R3313_01050 [Candidatus Saccharimonadales bacterium]|nr:hypothetical protein [Candidatus Saccharimonadales bacterium]
MLFSAIIFGGYLYFDRGDNSSGGAEQPISAEEIESQPAADSGYQFTNVYRGDGIRNIYEENLSQPTTILINSQTQLDSIWVDLFKDRLAIPRPDVDFDNQSVIVAMLEQKTSGDHLLTIQKIEEADRGINIFAQEKGPGEGCRLLTKNSRPVHAVITKKVSNETELFLELSSASAAPCSKVLLSP